MNNIRFLAINDFWCTLKTNLSSADFSALPQDVHCTLVFDEKLSDVNFHFTKNTKNQASKPQIKIVIIDKDVLYKIAEKTLPDFFLNLLESFDIESYKLRYENEVGFISFDNIEDSELGTLIKTTLIENLSDIAKINPKGNKLEIKGDLNERLEAFSKTQGLVEAIFEAAEYIQENYEKRVDGGLLLTHDNIQQVIRVNGDWFALKQFTIFKLLCLFVSRKTAYAIICKASDALEKIESAQTYSDTENDNYPVRIVLRDTALEHYHCPKCKKSGLEHHCYV